VAAEASGTTVLRIAIFTTHPIQNQAPWFRALAEDQTLIARVFFSYVPDKKEQGIGFGTEFLWDVPLRDGYDNVILPARLLPSQVPVFFRRIVFDIGHALRDFVPDVALIMGWNEFSLIQAFVACRAKGIPIILRGDANVLPKRPAHVAMLHRIYLAHASIALAVGDANAAFYRQAGMSADRIVMGRHCVDNERFAASADSLRSHREEIRAKWGISAGAMCVLFAGKLEQKKRVMDVLAALQLAHDMGVNVHGLIVGGGAEMTAARHLVNSLDLQVTFTSFLNQTEIVRAYVAADTIVLPSDYGETWGLVINEAMATGLPAIVSDRVGCAHDLVLDGKTGAVAPFGDVLAIAQTMAEWAQNSELRIRLGNAARHRVNSGYTLRMAAESLKQAAERAVRMDGQAHHRTDKSRRDP
jgi:glycosyltransferase involved in cell wall biosynthesis